MDRQTANELCARFGVAPVPPGANPQEWMDDNDVFDTGAEDMAARAEIVREVFADAFARAKEDHEKMRGLLEEITSTHHHVTAVPDRGEDWQQVFSGRWNAFSAMPYELEVGRIRGQLCYRHSYGNAVVFYVPSALLRECTEAFVEQQRKYYPNTSEYVHKLAEMQRAGGVLGGRDAIRAIELGLI